MRISDWSSDVCSSDLTEAHPRRVVVVAERERMAAVEPGDLGRSMAAVTRGALDDHGSGVLRHRRFGGDADLHLVAHHRRGHAEVEEIGRASCRARACRYG